MKRFIKNIILFSIPFVIGIVFICMAPYSKEFGYGYRNNVDCNTSWIYYRLFQNDTPIDIAFMGTSHTGCGINDSLIENSLTNQHNINKKVANLAYCTIGRDIQFPLVKDLLTTKNPELIIMEVTEEESKSSHQDFPYIADLNDVFQPELIYNPSLLKGTYSAFFSRFDYTRKRFVKRLTLRVPLTYKNRHSYVPFKFTADKTFLRKHKESQVNRYSKKMWDPMSNIKLKYPKKYIQKIVDLAKNKNIKLIFLYLPSYGSTLKLPLEYDFYTEFGEVWIPPNTILINSEHWVDGEHLNYTGSTKLAKWLTEEIANIK